MLGSGTELYSKYFAGRPLRRGMAAWPFGRDRKRHRGGDDLVAVLDGKYGGQFGQVWNRTACRCRVLLESGVLTGHLQPQRVVPLDAHLAARAEAEQARWRSERSVPPVPGAAGRRARAREPGGWYLTQPPSTTSQYDTSPLGDYES